MSANHAFEQKAGKWAKSPPIFFVTAFGSSSMAAYFFHEMLLYYRLPFVGFSFNAWWGKSCEWPKYWALVTLLIAITFCLVLVTDKVYRRRRRRRRGTAFAVRAKWPSAAVWHRSSGSRVCRCDCCRMVGSLGDRSIR